MSHWWAFVAVFFPGLLIGVTSSLLFLSLWKGSITIHNTEEREVMESAPVLVMDQQHRSKSVGYLGPVQRANERRLFLDQHRRDGCNETALESPSITGGPYKLLILVHSSPRALEMRNVIRDTWLKDNHRQRKFVARFVIGVAQLRPSDRAVLSCENSAHGDLLLLPDIVDPIKSKDFSSSEKLLQSFIWAEKNTNFHYILKCTDSTFALVDTIVRELEMRDHGRDYLWGFFAGGVPATKDGYLGEKEWVLCTHYLPYPEGGGYVISKGLIAILRALGGDFEHFVHDDIALGIWLSPIAGIEHRHDVRFNTGHYSRGCNDRYVVTHKETVQSMMKKDATLSKDGVLCDLEFSAKPSYHYNWTVPSNRCCVRRSGVP